MHETMKSNHGVVRKVHRKDIQALRGITVLAIIIFHASQNYLPNGYLGVDMFFLISGFVVTPLLLRMFLSNNGKHAFEFCKYELMLFLK
jgi:peptidoglycan/LPS O-acetylase OafA/YrhL